MTPKSSVLDGTHSFFSGRSNGADAAVSGTNPPARMAALYFVHHRLLQSHLPLQE